MDVPRKRRLRPILWISGSVLACVIFLFVDSMGFLYPLILLTGDAMDWKIHYVAGLGSINCGRVKIRGDASAATQCALQADAKSKSFRVVYNIQGIDVLVADGIVRTRSGQLFALSYAGCNSGCGFSYLQQRVDVAPCPKPYHLYVNPRGRLNCFQPNLSPPRDITSPNVEPH